MVSSVSVDLGSIATPGLSMSLNSEVLNIETGSPLEASTLDVAACRGCTNANSSVSIRLDTMLASSERQTGLVKQYRVRLTGFSFLVIFSF